MDIQRNIILIALAFVTYFIVLQWNQDYSTHSPTTSGAIAASGENSPASSVKNTQDKVSKQVGGQQIPSDDRAVEDVVAQDASPKQDDTQAKDNKQNTITIKTDVIQAGINLRGGDLVIWNLLKYPLSHQELNTAFTLFDNQPTRLYVAQSGLYGPDGLDNGKTPRPIFASKQTEYVLKQGEDSLTVDLTFTKNRIEYIKRFVFQAGSYQVKVSYLVNNKSSQPWEGSFFGLLKHDDSADPSKRDALGVTTFLGAAAWSPEDHYIKVDKDEFMTPEEAQSAQKSGGNTNLDLVVKGGWIAWVQHYFVGAWISQDASAQNTVSTLKDKQGNFIIRAVSPSQTIAPNESAELGAKLYAGPKIQELLKEAAPDLDLTVDYGWLWFISQPLMWLLSEIHQLVGNWGWSIVLLTLLIKVVFFPLSAAGYKSMAKMRTMTPKIQALRERLGDDRQKMSQELMALYRKEKINPMGGCLPILVQMPVFLALYWVLIESVQLRMAPWMGWIHDLAVMDPYFILPLIMGVTMFVQQQLNPTPPDPMQAKIMKWMPVMFTFFFFMFPAGLVLYWITNNILSIAQQSLINKQIEKAAGIQK